MQLELSKQNQSDAGRTDGGVGSTSGSAAWTVALKIGDSVTVRDHWNATTRSYKIAVPTKVLGIQRGTRSQSGVLIHVATALRDDAWLDAAWFEPNNPVRHEGAQPRSCL